MLCAYMNNGRNYGLIMLNEDFIALSSKRLEHRLLGEIFDMDVFASKGLT